MGLALHSNAVVDAETKYANARDAEHEETV